MGQLPPHGGFPAPWGISRPMRYGVLLVIRLASVDFISAIDLLQQNHAHKLMRERHLRETQQKISTTQNRVVKAD